MGCVAVWTSHHRQNSGSPNHLWHHVLTRVCLVGVACCGGDLWHHVLTRVWLVGVACCGGVSVCMHVCVCACDRWQAEEPEACPLCFKLVQGRAPKTSRKRAIGDSAGARTSPPSPAATAAASPAMPAAALHHSVMSPRTERARRWDHLRKIHGITTCDKCSLRLHRDMYYQHSMQCCDSSREPNRSGTSKDSRVGAWKGRRMGVVHAVCGEVRIVSVCPAPPTTLTH